ncbi:DUF6531 domain-containing protein [uncultured Actinomyces sp.]|uniref:DUF6531 domain-containing protein n=1 Tax=uncultured Actinomyces sp. TaxID=249061 RepID=UPI0028DBF0C1|nr:DUF6531 domain-containing protein [uncultured Actinomyces sp.]
MSDPVSSADVVFDFDAAARLIAKCNSAVSLVGSLSAGRRLDVVIGMTDFKGYFSQVFSDNAAMETTDAKNLTTCLRGVAKAVQFLVDSAKAENAQRKKAREWDARRAEKWAVEKGWDDLWNLDQRPTSTTGTPAPQAPAAPTLQTRSNPSTGSTASGGTSSARPDKLRTFASNTTTRNNELITILVGLRAADVAFQAGCGWGSLNATSVWNAFQTYIDANINDTKWAKTLANAFDVAGGEGDLSTAADSALAAALQGAGVKTTRDGLTITPAQVQGMPLTSGFCDDPVNAATGGFVEIEEDLSFTGGAASLEWSRCYNSTDRGEDAEAGAGTTTGTGSLGPGWSSWCEVRLSFGTEGEARWRHEDGRLSIFPRLGQGWDRAQGENLWLAAVDAATGTTEEAGDAARADGSGADPAESTPADPSVPAYEATDNSGGSWLFDAVGRPLLVRRGPGTGVRLTWEGERLRRLTHEHGRWLALTWDEEAGRLARVESCDGRAVTYDYDAVGRLVGARGGGDGERRYGWDEEAGLLARVTDADGVTEVDNTYDSRGRVATQRSPFGRVSRYTYLPGRVTSVADEDGTRASTWVSDERGRVLRLTDSEGRTQHTGWDRWGNLVTSRDRAGRVGASQYDARGRQTASLTPSGARLDRTWDEADRLTSLSVTMPQGGQDDAAHAPQEGVRTVAVTTLEYEGQGRNPVRVTDPEGGVTCLTWEGNLLTSMTDPEGVSVSLAYDSHGDVVAITSALGDTSRLVRDDAGNVVEAVTPSGAVTCFTYDAVGRLLSRRDPDGAVWRWEYSAAGRLTATVDPLGEVTRIERDPGSGSELATVDPLGRRLESEWDDLGNLAATRLPDGREWSYVHDALSRLRAVGNPAGGSTDLSYNSLGNVNTVNDPVGVTRALAQGPSGTVTLMDADATTRLGVDALGRATTLSTTTPGQDVRDAGHELVVRDLCGRVVEALDAEGGLTRYERDRAGRVVRQVDPTGAATTFTYDAVGRVSVVTGPDGRRTTYTYDADSGLVAVDAPTGRTSMSYDDCGRLSVVDSPGQGRTRFFHDRCGRVRLVRSDAWGTCRFSYDAAGQLVAVTNSLGGVTRYEYDDCGRMVASTDPLGNVTTRTYDALDRVDRLTDPLGRVVRAGYDVAGRQLWQEDDAGQRLEWGYDAAGVLERLRASGGGGGVRDVETSWRWRGRTLHVDGPGGPVELVHDRAGRLVEHRRDGVVVGRWTWDAAGRRTSFTGPGGEVTRYTYDAAGVLVGVEGTAFGTLTYEHDRAGRLVGVRGGSLSQRWEYDDLGRLRGYRASRTDRGGARGRPAQAGGGTGAGGQVLTWDGSGRLSAVSGPEGEVAYTYDEAGQLTGVDGPGGRVSYAYDVCGRVTAVERTGADGQGDREVLVWDEAGQLVERAGTGGRTRYSYDAVGRRTGEEGPGGSRAYSWAPTGDLVEVAQTTGDGTRQVTRIERDAMALPVGADGTAVSWDLGGPLPVPCALGGEPVGLLPGVGVAGSALVAGGARRVRGGLESDPWGLPALLAGDGAVGVDVCGGLRVGGLELLGARAYDPATMAFLSTDPLTHADTAPWAANPYSYAGNNPVALSDPTGLKPLTDAELNAYTDAHTGWHAGWNWLRKNKDYIFGGAMVIAGGIMAATPGWQVAGGMLMGAGFDTLAQRATTGSVNYGKVVVSGLLGAVGGGAGSALAKHLGIEGLGAAVISGAGAGALPGGVMGGYDYMAAPGPHTLGGFLQTVTVNTLVGAVTGGISGAAGYGLAPLVTRTLGKIRPGFPVYRVEGPGNARLSIDRLGNVDVPNKKPALFVNFGDLRRAEQFLAKRIAQGHIDDTIRQFKVRHSFAELVANDAVPEAMAKGSPIFQVDVSQTSSSYGLRTRAIKDLLDAVIPGSGR